jgi:hypothetical protein
VNISRSGRAVLGALLALACLFAFALPAAAQSEAERALEQRVKAAFLYRYTEFVTWPDAAYARPDAPFVMVVAGADAIADNLRSITAGRSVGNRPIDVKRIAPGDAIPPSQLVYIAGTDPGRVRDLVRGAPRHALVVTEAEGALDYGSVINFVLAQDRVRFDISLESAEKRGLRLSSRLLAVARSVRGSQ